MFKPFRPGREALVQRLERSRRRARARTRRAAAALPADPRIPRFPALKRYTPRQRKTIIRAHSRALRDIAEARGISNRKVASIVFQEGDMETRRQLRIFRNVFEQEMTKTPGGAGRNERTSAAMETELASRRGNRIGPKDPGLERVEFASVPVGDLLASATREVERRAFPKSSPGLRVLKVGPELFRATLEDPKAVASSSLRTAKESIAGIPQGVKMFVEDPGEAVEQIGADYGRRYGPLFAGDSREFRRRVQEESGLTPFALDAAAVAPPVGQAAGAVARTGTVARAGRVGRAVHRVAAEERPRLRVAGGPAGSKRQRKSRNLFVATGQHALDWARRRRFEKAAERAGFATAGGKLRPIAGRKQLRLPGLRPAAGEVVPAFSLRDAKPVAALTGRAARDLGGAKSRTRVRILQRQARVERQINRHLDELSTDERLGLKYMLQLGLPGDPQKAARELRLHRKRIAVEREKAGVAVPEVLRDTNDELRVIDELLADPGKHFTPKARQVANELRELQRREEEIDPALATDQARIRKLTPQAEHVGVQRAADEAELVTRLGRLERKLKVEPGTLVASHGHLAGKLPENRLKAARKAEGKAVRRRDEAQRRLETARREQARAKEAAERARTTGPGPIAGVQLVADPRKPFGVGTRRTADQRLREAEGRVTQAKRELDDAKAAVRAAREVRREIKARPGRRESADAFERRVRQAAEERALEAPAYWQSTIRPTVKASLRAAGTGGRAAARDRRFTGQLFRTGREETDPRVFTEGVMRNIKRRFNWGLVRRNVDVHAFEWSRGPNGTGITANQFLRELDERVIDLDTVDLIDVRELERRETLHAEAEAGAIERAVEIPEEVDLPTHDAIKKSRLGREVLELAETDPAHFRRLAQNRYVAVPKIVADELESATSPGSTAARSLEVVFKSKPSRVLLGFFNVPWLTFQVAANGMMSGLARAINPFDYVQAQRWWRSLEPDMREAIAPYIGIGYHHVADQPHLGATSSRFVNAWRAFKQTHWMRRLHKANPIDLFFRADEAQNNFFRKAVFYNQAKKAAAARMGREMGKTAELQERIVAILKRPPEDQLEAIIRDADLFEEHARHVNEWLGDYVSYSSTERATLGRAVMFYGYLRFSLRFTFYTMPVGHPVMANVLSNLGRLGADEIKRLLGVPPNFDVPTSMVAQMYFGSEKEHAKGLGRALQWGRWNPFLNAVTQMERPSQVFGIFSPLYQMGMDQLLHQSTFRGKDWKIKGKPTPAEATRPSDYFGSIFGAAELPIPGVTEGSARGRIFERQFLSMFAPYRMAEQGAFAPLGVKPLVGAQGDDSLLWDPRPIGYTDEETKRSIRRQARRESAESEGFGTMFRQVVPLVAPRPDSSRQILEREMEKIEAASGKRKRRRPSSGGGFGGGTGSGGGGFGGGTGSGGGF